MCSPVPSDTCIWSPGSPSASLLSAPCSGCHPRGGNCPDGPDTTLPDHADVQYLHDHEQVPPQTRKFGTDYQITLTHTLKQPPELPFGVALRAADSLFYPAVDLYPLTTAEIGDFKSLILYGLLVTAYAYVTVVQNYRI